MTTTRRDVLAGGATLAIAVAAGGWIWRGDTPLALPDGLIPIGRAALILHGGGADAATFVQQVRQSAPHSRISDRSVALLERAGFADAGAVLDRAQGPGQRPWLVALLDDAGAVVIEAMLQGRGAQHWSRARHGHYVLLTAQL